MNGIIIVIHMLHAKIIMPAIKSYKSAASLQLFTRLYSIISDSSELPGLKEGDVTYKESSVTSCILSWKQLRQEDRKSRSHRKQTI